MVLIFLQSSLGIDCLRDMEGNRWVFQLNVMDVEMHSLSNMLWIVKRRISEKRPWFFERWMFKDGWGGVRIKPIIKEACGRLEEDLKSWFLCVRGVWEGDRLAFFDNCIIEADAPSRIQRNTSYKTSLNAAERKV